MNWLNEEDLQPSDIYHLSTDNQIPFYLSKSTEKTFDYDAIAGRLNLHAMLFETVLNYDAYFLASVDFVKFLHEYEYRHLKDGIIAPVLRDRTIFNGKEVLISKLSDIHKVFLETGMYDGKVTKNAEYELAKQFGDEYSNVIKSIDRYTYHRNSKIVRNSSSQLNNADVADSLPVLNTVKKMGIEIEWKKSIKNVKNKNKGNVPSRGAIYKEAKNFEKEREIRCVADWMFYTNVWQTLNQSTAIDYPFHVHDVHQTIEESTDIPEISKNAVLEISKQIEGRMGIRTFANIPYEDLLETREYAKDWWDLLQKGDFKKNELWDSLSILYAQMIKVSQPSYDSGKTKIFIRVIESADLGINLAGIFLLPTESTDMMNYYLALGGFGIHLVKKIQNKKLEREENLSIGKGPISKIKESIY